MSDSKKTTKRRWANYSIYPRFQLSIVAFNLFTLFAAMAVVYYQIHKSFWVLETYAKSLDTSLFDQYKQMIDVHIELVQDAMITSIIFSTLFIVIYNIVFTHKSAGAIYHLKNYCQEIIQNGYTRKLTFRQGDMHPELPELINGAIERIQTDSNKSSK